MIEYEDVITINLRKSDMGLIRRMARAAEVGGSSQIRKGQERTDNLSIDQLVGQIGTYVGCKYLQGDIKDYRVSRYYANKAPTVGDGGADVTGSNIDFKASEIRNPNKDLLTYKLLVRPRERHDDWVYVLILVSNITETGATAHIMGWADTNMLPGKTEESGIFKGAYMLEASELKPLPPLRWWF
jgi:hypothetical protein